MATLNGIDWDSLNLPTYETADQTLARLQELHAEVLEKNNIPSAPEKGSPGFRPSFDQAREVAVMAALGLSEADIALVLNIELAVLKRYYRKELVVAANMANALVARKALQMAMSGGSPDMTKFWLKTRAKWKETSGVELSGPNGGAIEMESPKERLANVLSGISAKGIDGTAPKKTE